MAASLASLQEQADDLAAACPKLCPCFTPHGYDVQDLWGVVKHQGKSTRNAFERLVETAAAHVDSCFICGTDGTASTSGDDDDVNELAFTVLTKTSFKGKAVILNKAGFACAKCRALRSTSRFVQFAALRVGPGKEAEQALLLDLMVHLAGLNAVQEAIQADPDTLSIWVQEVYSRAYALQVAASNIRGWSLASADGETINAKDSGAVLQAVNGLLSATSAPKSAGKKSKKGQQQQQQATTPAAKAANQQPPASSGKRKTPQASPAAPKEQVQSAKKLKGKP